MLTGRQVGIVLGMCVSCGLTSVCVVSSLRGACVIVVLCVETLHAAFFRRLCCSLRWVVGVRA